MEMEELPREVFLRIFLLLDHHQNLAAAAQVGRIWKVFASENVLWYNLFKERWGMDCATFYAPQNSESWKDVYIVQDRCDRYGLGLKIIREGGDYYVIHQGEIQRHLGGKGNDGCKRVQFEEKEKQSSEIADSILFFIGDLEAACADAKRVKV